MRYRFGNYSLDTDRLELRSGEDLLAVEPQVFSLLTYLLLNREHVVTKEEIIDAVWQGRFISDGTLNSRINSLRRLIGDNGKDQAVIRTYPRRGFRFVAEVTEEMEQSRSIVDAPANVNSKPSIAVLPFENMSGDPEQEYFADGITEDLITALSHVRDFRVIARNSTFSYKGRSPDIRDVAAALDVRYVVDGSVRKSGNRVRVTAQLIEGQSGSHLWADRYDHELDNIFELQDELARSLVGCIEPEIDAVEQLRAASSSSVNVGVWDLYQRGLWCLNQRSKESMEQALQHFEQAVEMAPDFSYAWSGIAETCFFASLFGFAKWDAQKALSAARKAIQFDIKDAEAHVALGLSLLANSDNPAALRELNTAVELNPSHAYAHHAIGRVLIFTGHAAEAIPHIELAMRLSPNDPQAGRYYAAMALALLFQKKHADALEWAQRARHTQSLQWPAFSYLASILGHLGRKKEAEQALKEMQKRQPGINQAYVRKHRALISHQGYLDHLVDGLRKAGLPE